MPKVWWIIKFGPREILWRARDFGASKSWRRHSWQTSRRWTAQAGFSLIEALLAITVFGMLVVGLGGAIIYGRSSAAGSGYHQQATMLAEEGLEAARNIGDASFANLTAGTYGLAQSGGQWTFSGSSDTTGIFTRQVTIASVDSNRRTITSTVTWSQYGGTTGSVTLTSRLTNWAAVTAALPSWSNAVLAGSADATGTSDGTKVDTSGNYAYIVRNTTTSNFVVVNISTPTAPTIVSTSTFTGTPTNIAVSGSFAYVTTSTAADSLEVINISNPAAPTLAKAVSLTGSVGANGVYISGNFAYVVRPSSTTTGANEFNVINITTPTSPTVSGGYNNNIAMNEVYVSGNFAYVATSSTTQEMLVINITTPSSPTLAATYNPATTLTALTVTGFGNTVFLGMSTTLDAINITTPTSPTRLGTFTAGGTIEDLDVDSTGTYAFVGTNATAGEFQVVNVATPATMTAVKTVDIPGTTSTLFGLSYDSSLDEVAGASAADTQELVVFTKS